ncbi:MAG: hypothetical protein K8S55_16055, partial [Phycisphaerae bacterium]|nr:hypothetical protein [Phycisphaerae bacterium]
MAESFAPVTAPHHLFHSMSGAMLLLAEACCFASLPQGATQYHGKLLARKLPQHAGLPQGLEYQLVER